MREGWLYTGDLGYRDSEGFFFVVDRAKDMILRGGENVYCVEIENCLAEHAEIDEAAIVGVPDAELGERVKAVVRRVPGSALSPEAVRSHVAAHLASFKVPEIVEFSEQPLPRNPAGKLLKNTLRGDGQDSLRGRRLLARDRRHPKRHADIKSTLLLTFARPRGTSSRMPRAAHLAPRRARRIDYQRTRRRILDAARPLMAERGPESLTVSAVARAAELNRTTAYQHFRTRDELVGAVTDELTAEVGAVLGRPAAARASASTTWPPTSSSTPRSRASRSTCCSPRARSRARRGSPLR